MAYGGEILRSDGTYWLTPDQTPLNMVRRDDISYPNSPHVIRYYDTGVSTSRPCCIFMRTLSGSPGPESTSVNTAGFQIQRNGTWQFQLNGVQGNLQVRWYVFSNYATNSQPYDIAYYNEQGVQTWNGSSRPLQVFRRTITLAQAQSGGVILDEGQPLAVTPTFSADEDVSGGGIHLVATYCYKAMGNRIYSDTAEIDDVVYVGGFIGTYFYIRTTLYDL